MQILFEIFITSVVEITRGLQEDGTYAGFGLGLWLLPACLWPQALFARWWLRRFGPGDGAP